MSFDDLKLRTKVLIPLVAMAAVFACVVTGGALKLQNLTDRYGEIAGRVEPSMLRLSRAGRVTNELGRDAFGLLVYDGGDASSKRADEAFSTVKTRGDGLFDAAAQLNPV